MRLPWPPSFLLLFPVPRPSPSCPRRLPCALVPAGGGWRFVAHGCVRVIVFFLHKLLSRLQVRRAAVTYVLILLIVAIVGNAVTFYVFDGPVWGPEDSEIRVRDAIWYSLISITTIGYGDLSAQSGGARFGTIFFVIVVGLTAFSFLIGTAVDFLIEHRIGMLQGKGTMHLENHLMIVNFPGVVNVRQIIVEWRADPRYADQPVVLVNDQIDQLPFELPSLYFVKGSPLETETYQRAGLADAHTVMVLATGADDPNSDAIVASAVSVIEHLRADVTIVAECQSQRHLDLFKSVHCNSVVLSQQIGTNLIVQESQDVGASRLLVKLLSNQHPETFYTSEVTDPAGLAAYRDAVPRLLRQNAVPVGIVRDGDTLTDFLDADVRVGDSLIYVARERQPWSTLVGQA